MEVAKLEFIKLLPNFVLSAHALDIYPRHSSNYIMLNITPLKLHTSYTIPNNQDSIRVTHLYLSYYTSHTTNRRNHP